MERAEKEEQSVFGIALEWAAVLERKRVPPHSAPFRIAFLSL